MKKKGNHCLAAHTGDGFRGVGELDEEAGMALHDEVVAQLEEKTKKMERDIKNGTLPDTQPVRDALEHTKKKTEVQDFPEDANNALAEASGHAIESTEDAQEQPEEVIDQIEESAEEE